MEVEKLIGNEDIVGFITAMRISEEDEDGQDMLPEWKMVGVLSKF